MSWHEDARNGELRGAGVGGVGVKMEKPELPITLTIEQVARHLHVTRQTVYRLVHDGSLPASKLGPQMYRVRRDALVRWLEEHEQVEPVTERKSA